MLLRLLTSRKRRFAWKVCLFEFTGQCVYNESCFRLVQRRGEKIRTDYSLHRAKFEVRVLVAVVDVGIEFGSDRPLRGFRIGQRPRGGLVLVVPIRVLIGEGKS